MRASTGAQASLFASFFVFWTVLAWHLREPAFGLGADAAGLFGVIGAAGAFAAPIAGRLSDRRGSAPVIRGGIVLVLVAWVTFGLWNTDPRSDRRRPSLKKTAESAILVDVTATEWGLIMTQRDPGKHGGKALAQAHMRNGSRVPARRAGRTADRPFAIDPVSRDPGAPRVEAVRREERRRVALAERVVDATAEAAARLGDFVLILVVWAIGGGLALHF